MAQNGGILRRGFLGLLGALPSLWGLRVSCRRRHVNNEPRPNTTTRVVALTPGFLRAIGLSNRRASCS